MWDVGNFFCCDLFLPPSAMPVPYGDQLAPASPRRAQRSPSPEHLAACGLRYGSQREARRHCARCGWIANRRRWGTVIMTRYGGDIWTYNSDYYQILLVITFGTFQFNLSFHMDADETLAMPACVCVCLEWSSAVVRLLDILCFSDSTGAKRPWIIENPDSLGRLLLLVWLVMVSSGISSEWGGDSEPCQTWIKVWKILYFSNLKEDLDGADKLFIIYNG